MNSRFAREPRSGAATPSARLSSANDPRIAKRKQTLLGILDLMKELDPDDLDDEKRNFEDDRDVPSVEEHLSRVGVATFIRFQKRVVSLDQELRTFGNAARRLGSSVGLLSSAFHLRERLAQILHLFRENAADLFPGKVAQPDSDRASLVNPNLKVKREKPRRLRKPPPNVAQPKVRADMDSEDFPAQFEQLASDVMTFLKCLNEFPEFTDESVNSSISSFEDDLKYWASCLQDYKGQFKYPGVQRYLHDLQDEMGDHFDAITSTISMFIEVGVPTIQFAQKHGAANLLNLSTVATFFSAVTATTLQYSYIGFGDPWPPQPGADFANTTHAVNTFWFASLVFSIGAAVNSLLGLTWKQAMYRSPGHKVPWWVLIWIKRSPLVFLVLSVACFSVGLVLFCYASQQHAVTSTVCCILTAFTSFGLASVSAWFASERWAFSKHRGQKWLSDVLHDTFEQFMDLPGMSHLEIGFYWLSLRAKASWKRLSQVDLKRAFTRSPARDLEEASPGPDDIPQSTSPVPMSPNGRNSSSSFFGGTGTGSVNSERHGFSPRRQETQDTLPEVPEGAVTPPNSPTVPGMPDPLATARFRSLVRNMMNVRRAASPMDGPPGALAQRGRTSSSTMPNAGRTGTRQFTMEPMQLKASRVRALVDKLKSMETAQDYAAHTALVSHLQFSPNGQFVATASWDRTSIIFRVGDPLSIHRKLAHTQGFVNQVAWSPKGTLLLTKLKKQVKVWTEGGVCKQTFDRQKQVESITWCPPTGDNEEATSFLTVEGSHVYKLDLKTGKELDSYHLERIKLLDVAVTPDCERMLCVGPLLESSEGLYPSQSRPEKRLIVYNMMTKTIENQTPVINDVKDITLSKDGLVALVSYENKAPPQLWKLETVRDRETNTQTTRLTLRHTYMPKVPVDFAGTSYFGGQEDQLVVCAGKLGDIHIWDRESGSILHYVRGATLGGDLTCIAWNHHSGLDSEPLMFATGSHDGAIRIWSTPKPNEPEPILEPLSPSIHPGNEDRPAPGDAPMSRSESPFQLDELHHDRTDSPTNQQFFDAPAHLDDSTGSGASGVSSGVGDVEGMRQAVAFVLGKHRSGNLGASTDRRGIP